MNMNSESAKLAALVLILLWQTPSRTLRDAVASLSDYTAAHGRLYENNSVVQVTRLRPVGDCTLRLEREYPRAKTPKRITKETVSFQLGDFNPNVHLQITRTGNPSFLVIVMRSDGREAVETFAEISDGTRIKRHRSDVLIFMNSEESANQVAKALSEAITACGGES